MVALYRYCIACWLGSYGRRTQLCRPVGICASSDSIRSHATKHRRIMPRPGLVDVALSWSDLQHAVEENTVESLGRLGRFEENILVYRAFRAQVVEEWKSMTDFMYNRVFGWEPRVNEDGKKVVDICKADGKRIVWMQNDFPYSCDPGIEHHNVWCTEELAKDEVWHVIRSNRPHHDCLMFVNPPVLQSIPTVWHCHVFSRPLPDSGGIN